MWRKMLREMFGNWRLWLVAFIAMLAMSTAARVTPMQVVKTNLVTNEVQRGAMQAKLSPWSDWYVCFGVSAVEFPPVVTGIDLNTGQMTSERQRTKVQSKGPLVAASIIMVLASLMAAYSTRRMKSAWLWLGPMMAFAVVGYLPWLVASINGMFFVNPLPTWFKMLVIGGVAGAVSALLYYLLGPKMPQQVMQKACDTARDPRVQGAFRQAAVGVTGAGAQVIKHAGGVLQEVMSGGQQQKPTGWVCCPICGNINGFGQGKFPTQCKMCHWNLAGLEPDGRYCHNCGSPLLAGAKFCHHCSKLQS